MPLLLAEALVLVLVLQEMTQRVLEALVVRMDDEQRLVTADRVVQAGQAVAGTEVRSLPRTLGRFDPSTRWPARAAHARRSRCTGRAGRGADTCRAARPTALR